ncbi:unnamed protein product [Didymodactylos carnosus]|uniref:Uncharacterized protein n=1 Tax=Didymodactylos carnosus TaxID=1234261 RepID=A0A814I8M9_9BILA|nr:unnamed protein product [Didymodactylos carnosus]CAF3791942.1 unnamed protein product [Didymodactylos carnosus]
MSRYFLQKKDNDNISDVERKRTDHWFLGAIGLALIPADIVESTWVDIIDLHTPDYADAVTFNDYLVQAYVDRDVTLFEIETWNANNAILNDLPRTNNHVEGYNSRLESIFPLHPHIFEFVELLCDEHVYQHYQAEESDIQTPKRKKIYNDIDNKLKQLLISHSGGVLTNVQLAIKCGRAVKTNPTKK